MHRVRIYLKTDRKGNVNQEGFIEFMKGIDESIKYNGWHDNDDIYVACIELSSLKPIDTGALRKYDIVERVEDTSKI